MALLSEALQDKEFDVRMITRGLSKGLLQQDDVEKHVKKLADETSNAEYLNLETLLDGIRGKSGLR